MKDPLIKEKTPYEIFDVNPVSARPQQVMMRLPGVIRLLGAQDAQEVMRQILRPERRMVLDLFDYYWVEAKRENKTNEIEDNDVRALLKKAILESCSYDRTIDELYPVWTDLDGDDFSFAFRPISRSHQQTRSPGYKEINAADILETIEPDF